MLRDGTIIPQSIRWSQDSINESNKSSASTLSDGVAYYPTTYKGASDLLYAAESRLVRYGAFTAGYNGDGLRAWKRIGTGGKRFFLYDGTDLVCELDFMGMPLVVNTWGANGLIGRREGSTDVYFAYDPMGNVANTITSAGATNAGFDAYGTRYGDTAYATVGYGGQWGYYTDVETGLILCTYRYYDPQAGRWLTRDPIGYKGGINLYSYVEDNPVNHHDPSGNKPCKQFLKRDCVSARSDLYGRKGLFNVCYHICAQLRGNTCDDLWAYCGHISRHKPDYHRNAEKICRTLYIVLCSGS